ncbi:hypothetical protein JMM61_14790 [Rhodovulum sulfidophilum]|nr:hypothetical protein [Rhodovulum sulfidophilum]
MVWLGLDAIRELRISEQTFQRRLKQRAIIRHRSEENGECGMGTDRRKEPERLRKAVSDLTPDKPSPS